MTRYLLAAFTLLFSSLHAQAPGRADTAATTGTSGNAAQEIWEIDTSRSEVAFNLRLFAGRAQGRFNVWSGTIALTPDDWNDATVDVAIQTASVDTKNKKRDAHLRNEDFFEVDKYPVMTFKSTSVERKGDSLTVTGNLTIKDVTKPVVLKGKYLGTTPGEPPRMNFQATTTINRKDYGVDYDGIMIVDKISLGDEVTVELDVSAIRRR